ncbi:MAG: S24 family peptidase [Sulfurospirillaceae bacterium]|nr:S24 family peptidase [Sulfurospirillaceae bacterium]
MNDEDKELFEQAKKALGITNAKELAVVLNYKPTSANNWYKDGFSDLVKRKIQDLIQSKTIKYSENTILVPVFEAVAGCGAMGMVEQLRFSEDNFVFDSRVFPSNIITKDIAMIRIVGDSMAPYLEENDLALIELRNGRDIVPSEAVYLIAYDSAVQIKRVQIIGKKAIIKSDNKEYSPFELSINDFDIVGKIVGRLKFGSLMLVKE